MPTATASQLIARIQSADEALRECRKTWSSLAANAVRVATDFVNLHLQLESVLGLNDDLEREIRQADLEHRSLLFETDYRACLSDFRRCYSGLRSAVDSFEEFRDLVQNNASAPESDPWTIDEIAADLRSTLAMFARELVLKSAFATIMAQARGAPSDRLTRPQWTAHLNALRFEPFLLTPRCDRLQSCLTRSEADLR